MPKINCKKEIVNFENKPLNQQKEDGTLKPWTIGLVICELLLSAKLEPRDDPIEVYNLAKKFYDQEEVELSEEKTKELYTLVKNSGIDTIVKGQILKEFPIKS